MEIKTRNCKNWVKVTLKGELTIYSARELKDAILDKLDASTDLRLDLSGVTDIDSSGFQVLLLARREAERAGKVMTVTGHSTATSTMFDLYGIRAYVDDVAGDRTENQTKKGC